MTLLVQEDFDSLVELDHIKESMRSVELAVAEKLWNHIQQFYQTMRLYLIW
jgi:hypothetical protein